ncbi:MAG: DUF3892 domain-containing protein [Kyrpidia sp.]|nr:DUF3892 domain-containing protein [Kyrpidia sp.]HHY68227.1 DUF3892 domain-containing protein [Alicyclobacillus sp.]
MASHAPEIPSRQRRIGLVGERIISVKKNTDGDIVAVKLSSGKILQYDEAVEKAKKGEIEHVDVVQRYGRDILRSEADGTTENNLDRLPTFE